MRVSSNEAGEAAMKFLKSIATRVLFFIPPPVLASVYFEVASFLGRLWSRPLPLQSGRRNFINLGCGPRVVEGLINIDFFGTRGIDFGADLRYPLRIPDGTVDGIFCEHTLEHLTYPKVEALLQECHRVLKPGGVVRIVLPDLSLFLMNFCAGNQEWFSRWESLMFTHSSDPERAARKLETPLQAISFVTQEYGHVSSWDFETLSVYLRRSGFREITRTCYGTGRCAELLIDQAAEDRTFVSLYVEAVK